MKTKKILKPINKKAYHVVSLTVGSMLIKGHRQTTSSGFQNRPQPFCVEFVGFFQCFRCTLLPTFAYTALPAAVFQHRDGWDPMTSVSARNAW